MKILKRSVIIITIYSIVLLISSCGKKDEVIKTDVKKETEKTSTGSNELVKTGKEIFYKESELTGLKCADCHSDGTNDQNPNVKFWSDVKGANSRTSVYNGTIKGEDVLKTAGGSTICWNNYLKNSNPMTEDQINALNAYFGSLAKGNEPKEIKYTTIALPKPDKIKLKEDQKKISELTGDKSKGEKLYNETCVTCHGDKSKIKHVPSLFKDFEGNQKSIAYHIRIGVKVMPFYSYEKMTDQDIADVSAFILGK